MTNVPENNNLQIVIPQKCACCAAADGSGDASIYSDDINKIYKSADKGSKYITFNVKICDKCRELIKNRSTRAASLRLLPFVFLLMVIIFSFYGQGNIMFILIGMLLLAFISGYKWVMGNDLKNSRKYIGSLITVKEGEGVKFDAVFVNKDYEKLFKEANGG